MRIFAQALPPSFLQQSSIFYANVAERKNHVSRQPRAFN